MTTFPGQLHKDSGLTKTSFREGDTGAGVSDWFAFVRAADGGLATVGSKGEAAITNPATPASVISLLKGLLTVGALTPTGLLKAEDAIAASGDSGVMLLAIRRDVAAGSVNTDGDYTSLSTDSLGRLRTVIAEPTPLNATTTAYANQLLVKAAAGTLYGFQGYNSAAFTQWIQIHDAASLPAENNIPKIILAVPTLSNFSIDFGSKGRPFAAGIFACNSTTGPVKTIGVANCWIDAQYE